MIQNEVKYFKKNSHNKKIKKKWYISNNMLFYCNEKLCI